MNSKIIRIIGLAATVIGLGANLINDWADEQKMNEQIDKKVNEALAKRDADAKESFVLWRLSMSSIDTAIEITEYCLKQSRKNRVDWWYSDSFVSNSYSIWAAKELLTRLNNNRDIPPLITLENFEELMDEYACKNINNSFLFSCAKDTTRWIIDLLIA